MDLLYVEVYRLHNDFFVNIESLVTLYIYNLSQSNINLKIKLSTSKKDNNIKINLSHLKFDIIQNVPHVTTYCVWPFIQSKNRIISGLCSVCRQIIKKSNDPSITKLLGFRDACLMACSESSILTRFCEIDIIKTVKLFLKDENRHIVNKCFHIPNDLERFEYHLNQPVRIHNVYKVARQKNKNPLLASSTPVDKLNLEHCFGEGPFMTLLDAILYPCYKIFFLSISENIQIYLPKSYAWYNTMKNSELSDIDIVLPLSSITNAIRPDIIKHSLYTADPNRYRPEKRGFTKQDDIEKSIKIVNNLKIEILNNFIPYGHEIKFEWSSIPLMANPIGGALPKKRADRKCEQLESMAKAVVKLAKDPKMVIVDFCSGSGHLGILLAYLLPENQILLIENKERSLDRAMKRIEMLNLKNILIVQSNLDYFIGNFDIGVSLHACGVATDLVIENCIKKKAHFVACPCCYGGIKECHLIKYPNSNELKNSDLDLRDYFSLAHAADQTHDKDNAKTSQGYLCMDIIDTDRKLYAESSNYKVHLGKLQPTSCTNKNNLLVGIYKE